MTHSASLDVGFQLYTRRFGTHIFVVISPLVNLMKDQEENLKKMGNTAVSLCDLKCGEAKALIKGQLSVVYGTSEA